MLLEAFPIKSIFSTPNYTNIQFLNGYHPVEGARRIQIFNPSDAHFIPCLVSW